MKYKSGVVFLGLLLILSATTTRAATVTYTLDNVIQDDGQQMTGTFQWVYTAGDFENGTGLFTELYIPNYGSDISALNITFDVANSIEFSLAGNINNQGLDITLFLASAITPTAAANIDLTRSKYALEIGSRNGVYISGAVSPTVVPVPAAAWLFASGLLGLVGISRRRVN